MWISCNFVEANTRATAEEDQFCGGLNAYSAQEKKACFSTHHPPTPHTPHLFSLPFCWQRSLQPAQSRYSELQHLLFPSCLSGGRLVWKVQPEDAASLPSHWPLLTLLSLLGLADPRPTGQQWGLISGSLDPTTTSHTGYNRVPSSIWLAVLNVKYRAEDRSRLRMPVLSTADLWLSFTIKVQYIKH